MLPLHDNSRRPSRIPLITGGLIALNVFIFLYQFSLDPFSTNDFVYAFGFVPARFHWLSVFTSLFIHAGWLHIIGNMVFLWVFGPNIEDLLGHSRFLLFYLLCGAAAALAQYAFSPDSRIPQIGASGAIFGVMGAYLVKFPHSRITTVGWFIILFFSGVGSIADVAAQRGGVAYFAHIGGFFAGMLLILVLQTRQRFTVRRDLSW